MSSRLDPVLLVQYITRLATERGTVLTPLRLVKFLYLADLYYARENSGRTLTDWPWAFVHYGPYCGQALQAIDAGISRGLIAALSYESKFDGADRRAFRCDEDVSAIEEQLPICVSSPLKGAARKWADDSTRLLDHVYFETEPMLEAQPGARLDFSLARCRVSETPISLVHMKKGKLNTARVLVAKLAARYRQESLAREEEKTREPRDKEYERSLKLLEAEPLTGNLAGIAKILVQPEENSD